MNVKAVMFAGTGLFLSMVGSTMWVASDMAEIRERKQARERAECAAAPLPATDAYIPEDPYAPQAGPAAGDPPPGCEQGQGGDAAATEPGAATFEGGQVDPAGDAFAEPVPGGYADPYAGGQPATDGSVQPQAPPDAGYAQPAGSDAYAAEPASAEVPAGVADDSAAAGF